MFSWICPQCGREVPPSYTECPDCKGKGLPGAAQPPQQGQPVYAPQGPPQAPPPGYPPPGQPVYQAPPQPSYPQGPPEAAYQQAPPQPMYQQVPPQQAYAPPAPSYPQQKYTIPPPRSGLPTWLLTILFAVGFVAIVGGIYWLVGNHGTGQTASAPPPTNVESPAAKPGAQASPLQKYVEISGIRFAEGARKHIVVKCNVTNHSDEEISGLAGNVTIWGRTQKSEEDAVGTFSFSTDVGAQTSKEVSAPLTTKLKIYELPDWQNVTTDLQVTAPH